MAEPFLGEIRLMTFGFAPRGWALCDGQLLPINQNQTLYALLGTTYGGDGQVTFALPDLRARVPIHAGQGHVRGERGGAASHTLALAELPTHTHPAHASASPGDTPLPTGTVLADSPSGLYAPPANLVALQPGSVTTTGGSQPHENRQPFLVLSFCIALQGIIPSSN